MPSDDAAAVDRQPCRYCGEPIALEARACRHCGSTALVDLSIPAPPADARLRYQVVRDLRAAGVDAGVVAAFQQALSGRPPIVIRDLTRGVAREAVGILATHGLRGTMDAPRAQTVTSGGRHWLWIGIAAASAVVAAAVVLVLMPRSPQAPSSPAAVAPVPAAAPAAGPAEMSPRELARRSLPSTVSLRCRDSMGSGFFVASDLVITNAHVLCGPGDSMQAVLSDGRKLAAQTVKSDTTVDLGLVRVPGANAVPLALGDVGDLAAGDKVMIIGCPVGLEFTVHEGSVSSLSRSAQGIAYVQLDAKINPGNSGGPIIDPQGRVTGVVTLKLMGAEGIGLAVPINYAYGKLGFVAPPNPTAAGSPAFLQMVARAESEKGASGNDGGAAADAGIGRLDDRPLLVAATMDKYQRLVIRVLRLASAPPRYEETTVKVWGGGEAFCTMKGDIASWQEVDPDKPGAALPPEVIRAVRSFGSGKVFLGESPLRWDLCDRDRMRRGVELELEGAHPGASRLRLR